MALVLDSVAGLAATAQSGLSSNQTKKKIIRCTAAPKGPSVLNSWVQSKNKEGMNCHADY
jgi:hypothetical protein